ncbi:VanZ like family protein [Geodermatophilus obscurus]|uniref:VanZ like family protein n=1 Tax=Geodermatophilus obscurus TaxID=1861 RepID=A0A1I5EZE0_9ACTN|nr:VanZ family protein [Geodermatophilus obscurus]SFO16884.1 VanZ like family protein [Geodermatophilus obscurus]
MHTRPVLTTGAVAALAAVAALTLLPAGSGGWEWGSPAVEVRWYLTGLDSRRTVLQLLGNLLLLTPLAAVAVLRWPVLRRPALLVPAALAAGAAIETLQWVLPLGRVVSPVDAVLNTAGAVLVGLLVGGLSGVRTRHHGPPPGVGSRA